jgi:hypothetical protein
MALRFVWTPTRRIVAHGHSGCPTCANQTGLGGDIGERAVAVVLVETIRGAWRGAFETGAVKNEQVHPAIVVIVDERHSTSDDFDDVVLGVHAAVNNRLS